MLNLILFAIIGATLEMGVGYWVIYFASVFVWAVAKVIDLSN